MDRNGFNDRNMNGMNDRDERTEVVAALFGSTSQAIAALEDLAANGFDRSHINLVANDVEGKYSMYFDDDGNYIAAEDDNTTAGEGAAAGGGIGALLGGAGGVVAGLGLLAIPGIGPALAAGPIVAGLVGAGAGAVAGGLVGAMVSAGMPKEDADRYAEGVRRGGTLLLLRVEPGERAQDAHRILNSHNPLDLDDHSRRWQESGWRGYEPDAAPLTRQEIIRERDDWRV